MSDRDEHRGHLHQGLGQGNVPEASGSFDLDPGDPTTGYVAGNERRTYTISGRLKVRCRVVDVDDFQVSLRRRM